MKIANDHDVWACHPKFGSFHRYPIRVVAPDCPPQILIAGVWREFVVKKDRPTVAVHFGPAQRFANDGGSIP